jgi:hypothetical protein
MGNIYHLNILLITLKHLPLIAISLKGKEMQLFQNKIIKK